MKFLKCCLHILSFIADLSPIGTFKSAVELITGRDFISQEKLSKKERLLCIVGLIPVVGKAAQKIAVAKNCTKLAKGIFHANRIVKAVNIGNNIKKEGELEIEFALPLCSLGTEFIIILVNTGTIPPPKNITNHINIIK